MLFINMVVLTISIKFIGAGRAVDGDVDDSRGQLLGGG
jgi:hypothetical protein